MYRKPTILTNSDLAEGVYAASGCYTATSYIHQKPETGRGDYRIQVNGVHAADHTKETQWLHISFNQPVTYVSSQGVLESGDGSTSLTIRYSYHQNPTDNIGLGDVIVQSDPGLEVTGTSITD